jgi:CRISPR type III-A-associated RAMP protein Csm4
MRDLGFLNEWLGATAQKASPIAFSSLFPFQSEALFAIPPATAWPPLPALVNAPSPVFLSKIRWKAAQFVPLTLIDSLLTGQAILADQWLPDPESGCLLRRDRPSSSPFRITTRYSAAVDRVSQSSFETHSAACVEFEPGSGLWSIVRFADESVESTWSGRIQAAFRLLSDTGFGGRRTRGWGQAQAPEFQRGTWPGLLLPKSARALAQQNGSRNGNHTGSQFWLLSLYAPAANDRIDWTAGSYELTLRAGAETKAVRMIAEGSVVTSQSEPAGTAVDITPDGFAHPVYRFGLALALELPSIEIANAEAVETEPEALASGCPPETEPQPSGAEAPSETEPRPSGSGAAPDTEPLPSQAEGSSQESDDDF